MNDWMTPEQRASLESDGRLPHEMTPERLAQGRKDLANIRPVVPDFDGYILHREGYANPGNDKVFVGVGPFRDDADRNENVAAAVAECVNNYALYGRALEIMGAYLEGQTGVFKCPGGVVEWFLDKARREADMKAGEGNENNG